MAKKITIEDFVKRSKVIHGDKYNYDKVNLKGGSRGKEKIYCNDCKEYFEQTINSHLTGRGCRKCAYKLIGSKAMKTTEWFIEKSKSLYGDKFGYDKVKYKGANQKIELYCNDCEEYFWQEAIQHTRNKGASGGCPNCQWANKKLTQADFDRIVKKAHPKGKYKYPEAFINTRQKMKMWCNDCEKYFYQNVGKHLGGQGCSDCANNKTTIKSFIERSEEIHGKNRYGYSKIKEIKNSYTTVNLFCYKYNKYFNQKVVKHLNAKHGCPICRESKGERTVSVFLDKNNINYETQKMFKDCRNPKTKAMLKFDFYIKSHNMLIEYDGEFHEIKHPKAKRPLDKLGETKYRDKLKNKYADLKDITLLRIPYQEFKNIEEILKQELLKGERF